MDILKIFTRRKNLSIDELDLENLPNHIGIIMDGNGRWAKQRALPRSLGHKSGASTLKNIAKYANQLGIKYLTVYAFSTENWKRPQEEVSALMKLLEQYLDESLREAQDDTIRFNIIGDLNSLTSTLQSKIIQLQELTKMKSGMTLNIALNYGGRKEIVQAVKKLFIEYKEQDASIDLIDEDAIQKYLYTAGIPDVDLIIRPSGEFRLSNFLLWQSAYAEFYFDDILWPDYTEKDLNRALLAYQSRHRRFGGL